MIKQLSALEEEGEEEEKEEEGEAAAELEAEGEAAAEAEAEGEEEKLAPLLKEAVDEESSTPLPLFFDSSSLSANRIVAGTIARTLSQMFGHPVDTIKTRLQVKDPPKQLRKWKTNAAQKSIDTKQKLEKWLPPSVVHIASATIGTFASSLVRVPADTVKHRVQAYLHPNSFDALHTLVTSKGVRELYVGFGSTLMRDVPEIAIQFWAYEKMRVFVDKRRNGRKLTTPEHLALGAIAGAIAATCTMPLDLVKTRQQCGMRINVHSILLGVLAEKGFPGLFAGLPFRVIHVSLMSSVFFGLFEYCKMITGGNPIGAVRGLCTESSKVLKPERAGGERRMLWKSLSRQTERIDNHQLVYTQ
ncbi:hypothetical protein CBR_g8633 [Chara braunii]|uniref:Mitochondrial carrier protein n=1 Tax=Chara braunii TaxID=69332 RepID=A0A388JSB5_CHABU|nr:hypothetical protein CBR_g8633 [Chara braunii]|eukprot:GBG60612.1 hypothetical protein CBR_g8633 [Chara braunii]